MRNFNTDTPATSQGRERYSWLLSLSLLLAVLFEVSPVEAGYVYMHLRNHEVVAFLALKAAFLAVILCPLILYSLINAKSFVFVFAHRRAKAVAAIVFLNLVMNAFVWFR